MLDQHAIEAFLERVHSLRIAGETEAIVDLFDEDATFRIVGGAADWPFSGPAVGKAAIRTVIERLVGTFAFLEYRVEKAFFHGPDVSVHCAVKIRHNPSGRTVDTEVSDFLTFRDGKCVAYTQFADTALALELGRG